MGLKEERLVKTEFAPWVGIVGNFLLAVMKGIVGLLADSRALLADAVHSASDAAGSLAVLIGLRATQKPPDKDRPYGHGKAEPIAAIIVSIVLLLAGLEIVSSSFKSLFRPLEAPDIIAAYAAVISFLVKEGMYRYTYRVGKKYGSQAVTASAPEHRSAAFSSLAALIGIAAAAAGGKWNIPFLLYMDSLAGIFVSFLVLKKAYSLLKESIHDTLDHVLHEEEAKELREAVEQVNGVIRVDELRAREHGHYVIVDVKIGVDPHIKVVEGHAIAKEVKETLRKKFPNVKDVLIHVNPYDPIFPYRSYAEESDDEQPELVH
ncbi:cation diffusion facilitator family transporter [Bacillaceae bacterium]